MYISSLTVQNLDSFVFIFLIWYVIVLESFHTFFYYNYLFIVFLGVEKGDFLFKKSGHHFEPSSPGLHELMSMPSFVNWHVTRINKYCR